MAASTHLLITLDRGDSYAEDECGKCRHTSTFTGLSYQCLIYSAELQMRQIGGAFRLQRLPSCIAAERMANRLLDLTACAHEGCRLPATNLRWCEHHNTG